MSHSDAQQESLERYLKSRFHLSNKESSDSEPIFHHTHLLRIKQEHTTQREAAFACWTTLSTYPRKPTSSSSHTCLSTYSVSHTNSSTQSPSNHQATCAAQSSSPPLFWPSRASPTGRSYAVRKPWASTSTIPVYAVRTVQVPRIRPARSSSACAMVIRSIASSRFRMRPGWMRWWVSA
jgi:hypothetical protein